MLMTAAELASNAAPYSLVDVYLFLEKNTASFFRKVPKIGAIVFLWESSNNLLDFNPASQLRRPQCGPESP